MVDQYAGLYWGKQQPETYLGIYGRTPIVGKLWAVAEWARNSNTDKPTKNDHAYGYSYRGANKATTGYAFELHYGNAKKKGDWEAALTWLKADQNILPMMIISVLTATRALVPSCPTCSATERSCLSSGSGVTPFPIQTI